MITCLLCREQRERGDFPRGNCLRWVCRACLSVLPNTNKLSAIVSGQNLRGEQNGQTEGFITALDWARVLYKSGGACAYCRRVVGVNNLALEHVKAIANGGRTTPDNIAAACKSCNSSKGAKTEWTARSYADGASPSG